MLVRIGDPAVMLFAKFILRRIRIRVPPQPELLDEVVPLLVVAQALECLEFLVGNDPVDVLVYPLLIRPFEFLADFLLLLEFLFVGELPFQRVLAGVLRRCIGRRTLSQLRVLTGLRVGRRRGGAGADCCAQPGPAHIMSAAPTASAAILAEAKPGKKEFDEEWGRDDVNIKPGYSCFFCILDLKTSGSGIQAVRAHFVAYYQTPGPPSLLQAACRAASRGLSRRPVIIVVPHNKTSWNRLKVRPNAISYAETGQVIRVPDLGLFFLDPELRTSRASYLRAAELCDFGVRSVLMITVEEVTEAQRTPASRNGKSSVKKKILIAVAVLVVAGGLIGLTVMRAQSGYTKVISGKVVRQDLASTVSGTGQIKPKTIVNIGATAFGRITHLYVKEGDKVKTGQVLATIENVQPEANVDAQKAAIDAAKTDITSYIAAENTAKANLEKSQADLEQKKLDYDRYTALYNDKLVSKQDFDAKKSAYDVDVATVNQNIAALAQAKAQTDSARGHLGTQVATLRSNEDSLNKTVSVAPFDGIVTNEPVREGETVVVGIQNAQGSTLMTLADMSVITAEVKVDETDIVNVRARSARRCKRRRDSRQGIQGPCY